MTSKKEKGASIKRIRILLTPVLHTGAQTKRSKVRQMWVNGDFSGRTCSAPYMESGKIEYSRRWWAMERATAILSCGGMQH